MKRRTTHRPDPNRKAISRKAIGRRASSSVTSYRRLLRAELEQRAAGRLPIRSSQRKGRRRPKRSTLLAVGLATVGAVVTLQLTRRTLHKLADRREVRLNQQRGLDSLTGLPNRGEAQWWLKTRLSRAQTRSHRLAVMLLDLDGFSEVNATHGRDLGDHVLQVTAARMQSQLRTGDMVCRVGNDTFMVIMDAIGPDHLIARIGERIVNSVAEPISFHGEPVQVTASAGFALSSDRDKTPDLLLDRAHRALVQAKGSNRSIVQF